MGTPLLDPADPVAAAAGARLDGEPIIWLGTVSPDRRPHTVPVWFHWSDPQVTIFSRPDTAKTGRLREHGAVSLSLDSAAGGADIVLAEGDAVLPGLDAVRDVLDGFERKYRPMLGGQPFDQWLETFSQPIVVTVGRVIAWRAGPAGLEYRSLPPRN